MINISTNVIARKSTLWTSYNYKLDTKNWADMNLQKKSHSTHKFRRILVRRYLNIFDNTFFLNISELYRYIFNVVSTNLNVFCYSSFSFTRGKVPLPLHLLTLFGRAHHNYEFYICFWKVWLVKQDSSHPIKSKLRDLSSTQKNFKCSRLLPIVSET